MKILVTGSAGFIGSELCIKLLERGDIVIGIDNHNDYYDPNLKEARLARHLNHPNYTHLRLDISDKKKLEKAFQDYQPNRVVNLAAQAGVRYSIENPHAYVQSNIVGFLNILESCRHHKVEHLIYASSSSVYGKNTSIPFSVQDNVDHPISLYAASKKSNELMAHAYSALHNLPTTGLRFFTVYGPWGRPDMALYKFTEAILKGKEIQVFNFGKHSRDFTYIEDIVEGVKRVIDLPPKANANSNGLNSDLGTSSDPWRVYNMGNGKPIELLVFINALEEAIGKKATLKMLPLKKGDVPDTFADLSSFFKDFSYLPATDIETGVVNFVEWYKSHFGII